MPPTKTNTLSVDAVIARNPRQAQVNFEALAHASSRPSDRKYWAELAERAAKVVATS